MLIITNLDKKEGKKGNSFLLLLPRDKTIDSSS